MQMYMCYLDESGNPEPGGTTHFVLLGLAVPTDQWKPADTQVRECASDYGLGDQEVHAAWMARRYIEQERIPDFDKLSHADRRTAVDRARTNHLLRLQAEGRLPLLKETRKNYKKTAGYVHLTRNERMNLLRRLCDIVASWTDARLFAEVVRKQHYSSPTQTHMMDFSFEKVVERFERFLRHRGDFLKDTLCGLLVQDNNPTMAKQLTSMMLRFHSRGTRWCDVDHIIETPLFVDSCLTTMVQVADLCAFATRRFVENDERDLFDRIYGRFDKAGAAVVGVRHFTDDSCKCRICRDRSANRPQRQTELI